MCCHIDKLHTAAKLAELKSKTAVISGYKILSKYGEAISSIGYQYGPGTHAMSPRIRHYNKNSPRGFHFYPTLKIAKKYRGTYSSNIIVRCQIPVVDIIGLQTPGTRYEQGVTNSLFISENDWVKAGLPLPKPEKAVKTK
jgi:hypothetical protein